jgi:hypothetical protein
MASVNHTNQYPGLDDSGFQGEDLTMSPQRLMFLLSFCCCPEQAMLDSLFLIITQSHLLSRYNGNADNIPSPVREGMDCIPLPAHEGDKSFVSMSFDSEAGYGEKIAGL